MKILFAIGIIIILTLTACIKEGKAPIADFDFTPIEGSRYSIFYFDASKTYDPDNSKYSLKYRWDFNGDGIYDTDFSIIAKASFRFPTIECFNVTLEVIDPEANSSLVEKTVCVSDKNNEPYAIFSIIPPIGSLGMEITLDATKCFDWEEPLHKLLTRWDLNGDKIWDTEFSNTHIITTVFNVAGIYNISMEVKDSDGASATLDKSIEIVNTHNEYGYFTDHRDRTIYGMVKIGNQWIMAQNLVYGTYVDNLVTPLNNGLCEVFAYNNREENIEKYGGLYLWDEVLDYTDLEKDRGLCPEGWHLPSDQEWKILEQSMGMEPSKINTTGWDRGQGIGRRLKKGGKSGFEAGLFGYRYPYRSYADLAFETRFWSSSIEEDGSVWVRGLAIWSDGIMRGRARNNYAYSVRCFKD